LSDADGITNMQGKLPRMEFLSELFCFVRRINKTASKNKGGNKGNNMSIERVRDYFKKFGIEDRVLEFPVSSATVELAAKALGCEPDRIAKSLSFMINGEPAVIVTSGEARIDNHKFKECFHTKAKMLTRDEVSSLIGHEVGGVCPFAVNAGVKVFLDNSLKKYDTVFPACGSSNSAIELGIDELEKYSKADGWVDVTKIL
jgi:prolyl-tRNA editing enzyme YbaK/EbsC (Cys-tRNA(Pro) deacylase)